MDIIRKVGYCPHCGNSAPQRLIQSHYNSECDADGQQTAPPEGYFVSVCDTCNGLLLYLAYGYVPEESDFLSSELLWPDDARVPIDIPEEVGDIYREALKLRKLSPAAFAIHIRKALEAVCDEQRVPSGTLDSRLKKLSEMGSIPSVLGEMAFTIKDLGNIAAHDLKNTISVFEVCCIEDYFRAILDYLYVMPAKLELYDGIRNQFKKKSRS